MRPILAARRTQPESVRLRLLNQNRRAAQPTGPRNEPDDQVASLSGRVSVQRSPWGLGDQLSKGAISDAKGDPELAIVYQERTQDHRFTKAPFEAN